MIITELDKAGAKLRLRRASEANLSVLQRSLLKEGLFAYLRSRPLDLACGLSHPGCFGIKTMMRDFSDREERARRRAAAGLALKRLIRRGLLERCAHGKWRLTPAGVALAQKLYPEIKPDSEEELSRRIAFYQKKENTLIARSPRRRGSRRLSQGP